MYFFTLEDITLFEAQAGRPYDKSNAEHRKIGQQLRHGVFAKTKRLANLVAERVRLFNYKVTLRHSWSAVDWGTKTSIYKPYTWASFTKQGAATPHVFFTLGVDGGRDDKVSKLVIKLDYQRKTPPARSVSANLTHEQKALLQNFLDSEAESNVGWYTMPPNILTVRTEQELVEWAANFIQAHDLLYDEMLRLLQPDSIAPVWGGSYPSLLEANHRRASYILEKQRIEPADTHYEMSIALWRQLCDLCGAENVAVESSTGYGTRIDLEVRNPTTDARLLFELKSSTGPSSLRPAVREALGQLLEYAFWPNEPARIQSLIIATPNPVNKVLSRFLARLSLPSRVDIEYLQVDPVVGANVSQLSNILRKHGWISQ
ncbi:MAG TPA: hypothetical protein VFO93_19015 [Hymenobacter sp.]|uniref:hypothetical protein n=1 Tax=Hymenobacter sp. TaxID=1898978 RepID=UPI002D8010C2|nr:hypothetical protein [Hymenobacter sp.]HET9505643.1 hypothetical protein [Hymenobacter sp.]